MNVRNVRILGTGKYLPKKLCKSADMDEKFSQKSGWVERKSGVFQRHFASPEETTSNMAIEAIHQAIREAKVSVNDIDCIVGACGVMEQALPGTACLVQKKLGLSGIPCFDINSTCLSFVTALDMISYPIEVSQFKNVIVFSSDIPSIALNWDNPETWTIFGDGAAAVVLSKTNHNQTSKIIASLMQTYSEGYEYCQVKGGGTKIHPSTHKDIAPYFLFEMDGKAALRMAVEHMEAFMESLFARAQLTMDEINWVVPHQASKLAVHFLRKRLNIPKEKVIDILSTHGNQVATSIPTALHEGISSKIQRGDKVLLIGSSAGISIGGIILEY